MLNFKDVGLFCQYIACPHKFPSILAVYMQVSEAFNIKFSEHIIEFIKQKRSILTNQKRARRAHINSLAYSLYTCKYLRLLILSLASTLLNS